MIRIKTKETASWLIGISAGLCAAVALAVAGAAWYAAVISFFVTFILISVVALWMMKEYVAYKLRPIYSTVFSRDIHTKQVLAELKDNKVENITEQLTSWAEMNDRELSRLKDVEKFRKQYLGNVAYELKMPMFNVQGYLATLLDGGLEDELTNRKYVEKAEKCVSRMIQIVNDLDTIARLESELQTMKQDSFDMVALCQEVAESLSDKAQQKNITLTVKGADNLPSRMWVCADKFYIGQVLENLIGNSITYGRQDGLTKITCRDLLDKILVEVEDTGIGIAQENLGRVFQRFYRTDTSASRENGGTGLGLAIVKHIIEGHGEHVSVRSELGKGSTFAFTLKKVNI